MKSKFILGLISSLPFLSFLGFDFAPLKDSDIEEVHKLINLDKSHAPVKIQKAGFKDSIPGTQF